MADYIFVPNKPNIHKLTKTWNSPVGRFIVRKTNDVAFYSRRFAPSPGGPGHGRTKINFATGELSKSIIVRKGKTNGGELEGRVVAIPKHAIFVHEGTAPHVIKAKNAPALVFYWHRVGKVVMFDSVNHPGNPTDPFLLKGLRRTFNRS